MSMTFHHKTQFIVFVFDSSKTMYFFLLHLLFLTIPLIDANTDGSGGGGHGANPTAAESSPPLNDLGLTFGHTENTRNNNVVIYFDISNSTLKEYRYYYYSFRPFGSHTSSSEFLPRQRLLDTHNSLRIIGLHDGDYVVCLSFIDEYETIFKPRYACYEFTLGEKTVGSHHGSSSGYLAPLLFAVAFIIHVFIAVVHHIKAKNYGHKLLHRFIDVTPKATRRRIIVDHSLEELDRELDYPHVPASVQRRLSRVAIDPNYETEFHPNSHFLGRDYNDELPLYTLPHHSRRVSVSTMQPIPEYQNSNTMDSISSMRHLMDSTPWIKRASRSVQSSIRRKNQLHV